MRCETECLSVAMFWRRQQNAKMVFRCLEEITTVVTGDSEIILEQGLRPNGNMARNAGPLADEVRELLEGKGSGI